MVNPVHTGIFLRSTEESTLRAMVRLRPFNAITAVLLLIALGESIVAIGIGVEGGALGGSFVLTSVLGLALAAALWWFYFDGEDERAERSLAAADRNRRPWLALNAFGYAFLPVLGGIVVLAAGVKLAIVHYGGPIAAPTAWFLAAGAATYLLGLVAFRRLLGLGPVGLRLIIAGLAAATGIIGLAVSPQAELAGLVVLVGGGAVAESRSLGRRARAIRLSPLSSRRTEGYH
jgi:low temperature requirement protein LtrA